MGGEATLQVQPKVVHPLGLPPIEDGGPHTQLHAAPPLPITSRPIAFQPSWHIASHLLHICRIGLLHSLPIAPTRRTSDFTTTPSFIFPPMPLTNMLRYCQAISRGF